MDMSRDPLALVPDEALVVLYANGDREAARALTSRLLPRILGYAARILQDRAEAEDVAQEAMLRLWRVAPNWRPDEAKVTTWLYRVVVNLCTDRLRARQRRKLDALDDVAEPADSATSVVTAMIDVERQLALETALATLPDRQRQAVVLRHIEGLTNPEIADIMAIGVEAVESLTARGKRTLTQILSGQKAALGYEGVE
ncbi:MAG: RNA polymerase sigma factor [Microgenomates group bacterium]|jgi:RNA polymerase sigma factor (sigma-70 family)